MIQELYLYLFLGFSLLGYAVFSSTYPFTKKKVEDLKDRLMINALVKDYEGFKYISYALLVWASLALFTIICQIFEATSKIHVQFLRSIFSTVNNCFFLIAFHYFNHTPLTTKDLLDKIGGWRNGVIYTTLCAGALTLIIYIYAIDRPNFKMKWILVPDLLLSIITLALLSFSLHRMFSIMDMKKMIALTIITIFAATVYQIMEFVNVEDIGNTLSQGETNDTAQYFLAISTKTSLITLIYVAITGWIFEKVAVTRKNYKYTSIELYKDKSDNKLKSCVIIDNDKYISEHSTRQFGDLLKLCMAAKYSSEKVKEKEDAQRWVERLNTVTNNHIALIDARVKNLRSRITELIEVENLNKASNSSTEANENRSETLTRDLERYERDLIKLQTERTAFIEKGLPWICYTMHLGGTTRKNRIDEDFLQKQEDENSTVSRFFGFRTESIIDMDTKLIKLKIRPENIKFPDQADQYIRFELD